MDRLGALRRQAETMRHQVAAETRRAAQQLRRSGLSVRDVAEILGVSAARVAQLEREAVD
jgi:predicted transcriptional regulator